jgi:IPT/TIG domain
MSCHFGQLRVNLVAISTLLLTLLLLVTASTYGWSISLSPKQGPPETEVTVTGSGFGPNHDVPIELGESPSPVATAHVNDNRAFTTHLTIPASTPAGNLRVSAIIGNSGSAEADFTVTAGSASKQTQASVTLTPAKGPPGTVIIADGSGFTPNQPVMVTQSGGRGVTGNGETIRADQFGFITMKLQIAGDAPPGVIIVTLTQDDNTAVAHFQVRLSSSGGGKAHPVQSPIDYFARWLDACVNGRLNEPMCNG